MDECKREFVQQWFVKAAHDLGTARKAAADPDPYLDMAVFHCQQAAEKAVKGFLVFHDQPFRKIHEMEELVGLAMAIDKRFASWLKPADDLTPYAVDSRYPALPEVSREQFERALTTATNLYEFVLSLLPAEVHPPHECGKRAGSAPA